MPFFQLGQMVALKSNPSKQFPIIEILPSQQAETRYKVFVDNTIVIYYQSQLVIVTDTATVRNISQQAWQDKLEQATSPFLSAKAIQNLVSNYLQQRLGKEQDFIHGDKPTKTLRLNKEAKQQLLQDFQKAGMNSKESVAHAWQQWLKGDEQTLSISFNQEGAAEHKKTQHIDAVHPLTKQAMQATLIDEQAYTNLSYRQ